MPSDSGVGAAPGTGVQEILDSVEVPLALTDADGYVLEANLAFAAACDLPLDRLLHSSVVDLLEWPAGTGSGFPGSVPLPAVWRLRRTQRGLGPAGTTTPLGTDGDRRMLLQLSQPEGRGARTKALGVVDRALRVQEVAVALSEAQTVNDVTDVMLEQAASALGSAGLLITLLDADGLLTPVRVEGYGPEMRDMISRRVRDLEGAPMQAVLERKPLVFQSPEDYLARFPGREELVYTGGMKSWVYMPLMASGRVIGTWSVSYSEPHATPPSDLALLTTLAVLCAQTLERARLYEREHEMANVLQRAIAPGALPVLPGVRFGARYVPATVGSVVGGDFFDVLPLPGNRAAVLLGDVVGHDIRAAALMGQVRATLRAYAAVSSGPGQVLERTNRLLGERPGQIATCCCLEMDLETGVVTMARAGHPPPLHISAAGGSTLLEVPGGLPLGAGLGERYPETTVALDVDDVLLLYTDGLVETRARPLDHGLAQLVDAASETGVRAPEALVEHLLSIVGPERHTDDIALLALQRRHAFPRQHVLEPD